jgi:hypothetical protein
VWLLYFAAVRQPYLLAGHMTGEPGVQVDSSVALLVGWSTTCLSWRYRPLTFVNCGPHWSTSGALETLRRPDSALILRTGGRYGCLNDVAVQRVQFGMRIDKKVLAARSCQHGIFDLVGLCAHAGVVLAVTSDD